MRTSPRFSRRSIASIFATLALFVGLLSAPVTGASADEGDDPHLSFSVQPVDTDAGQTFDVVVQVEDGAGNPITGNTDPIALTLNTGVFGGSSGLTSVGAVDGVATFDDLTIDDVGSYTITADDPDASLSRTSDTFSVTPADPDHLTFSAQPVDTTAGATMGDITVVVEDAFGNVVDDASGTISLAVGTGPGDFTSAPAPQAVSGGSATFSSLAIETAGTYGLITSTDIAGPPAITSDAFEIIPDAPADLVFGTGIADELPVSGSLHEYAITPAVTVSLLDQFGNVVSDEGYDDTVVTVSSTPGSLGPDATASAMTSAGVASFDDLSFDVEGTYVLDAASTTPVLSSTVASEEIEVTPHADLGVTLAADPDGTPGDEVVAGTNETFTATVTNHGPSDNTSYDLDFTITPDLVANTPTTVTDCDPCTGAAEPEGGTDAQSLEVAIPPSYTDGGALDGDVEIVGAVPTQEPHDDFLDTATAELTVVRQADLALTGSFTDPVTAGTNGTLELSLDNEGPSDNEGYSITVPLPASTTFVSGASCTYSSIDDEVTCQSLDGITAADDPDSYSIVLHVAPSFTNPDTTGTLTIEPTVSTTTDQGADTADDSPAITADVESEADLTLTQAVTVNPAATFDALAPGNRNTVSVQWVVTNDGGPSDALEVGLDATFPAELLVTTADSPCTTTSSSVSCDLGTLQPGDSVTISATAAVATALRDGPYTKNIAASVSSITPDPDSTGPSDNDDATFPTVPDAPVLVSADPGNNQIAVVWTPGSVPPATDNGGSAITSYDVILVPNSGPTVVFNVAGTPAGGQLTATVAASNTKTYTVTVEARNAAGDSSPSNAKVGVAPCTTCVLKTVSSTTTVTLNTGNTAAGATCPQKGVGATGADKFVSCYQFPANSAKSGLPLSLYEGPTVAGDCGDDACIGNQGVNANPAGDGAGVTITQYVWVDRTVTTDIFGHPCSQLPCNTAQGVYAYEVYVNGTLVGTSIKSSWCKTSIPAGKTACVKSLTELNSTTAPNGKDGKGDLQIIVLLKGDPRTTLSG